MFSQRNNPYCDLLHFSFANIMIYHKKHLVYYDIFYTFEKMRNKR